MYGAGAGAKTMCCVMGSHTQSFGTNFDSAPSKLASPKLRPINLERLMLIALDESQAWALACCVQSLAAPHLGTSLGLTVCHNAQVVQGLQLAASLLSALCPAAAAHKSVIGTFGNVFVSTLSCCRRDRAQGGSR